MTSRIYPLASSTWDEKEYGAMQRVIDSGLFTMGKHVKEYEENFAKFFGAKYAVMSNSGSSANLLALAAIRYSSKFKFTTRAEVIVPAVSWSTTYYPVSQLGFNLRFVDIDPKTLNLDVAKVLEAIGPNTAGIFAVNLLGNPADLEALTKIAAENNLFLIEDNCESMGALINGKYAGTFGLIGTFSSFFSHHISTMEGGMSVTDDLELAQIMTSLRAHGWTRELPESNLVHNKTGNNFEDSFRFVLPGYNLRPLELSGAIGKEQLLKLPNLLEERRKNAEIFQKSFQDFPHASLQKEHGSSSWFGFSLVLKGALQGKRSEVARALDEIGIDSRPIVAGNFTRNPVMKHLSHAPLINFPAADKIHDDGLFVGNHHFNLESGIAKLLEALVKVTGDR